MAGKRSCCTKHSSIDTLFTRFAIEGENGHSQAKVFRWRLSSVSRLPGVPSDPTIGVDGILGVDSPLDEPVWFEGPGCDGQCGMEDPRICDGMEKVG